MSRILDRESTVKLEAMTMMSRRSLLTMTALGATAATVVPARAFAAPPATGAARSLAGPAGPLAGTAGPLAGTAGSVAGRAGPLDGDEPWYAPMCEAIALEDEPAATAAQVAITTAAGTWAGRSGVADVRTGAPVPAGARFRIGSVTKTFTATVVLQLVAEHRLSLDAPLTAYLPGLLPAEYAGVTVRHLLDHRTGLPSPAAPEGIAEQIAHRYDRWTPERIVTAALANEREFEPGTRQHYTNMGYIVAGLLIGRVTGRSYGQEIERRIVRPLGLRDTRAPGHDPEVRGPHARGYQTLDGRLIDVTSWDQSVTPASGDVISSLRDLDLFTRALFGGRLLPSAQQRELFALPALETGTASYGIGLQRLATLPDGRTVWGKSGARYGYSAALAAVPGTTARLVYSVNSTDAKSEAANPVLGRVIGAALALL